MPAEGVFGSEFWCPTCGKTLPTRIIDSRIEPGDHRRRRRECLECQTRFTTIEVCLPATLSYTEYTKMLRLLAGGTRHIERLRAKITELQKLLEDFS